MIRILWLFLFAAVAIAGETVKEPELSPSAERKFRAKLLKTRIPKIDFQDSTVREAIDFLIKKAKDLGPPEPRGVGIPLRIPEGEARVVHPPPAVPPLPGFPDGTGGSGTRITLKMTNATLEEILREICHLAKLRWNVGPNGPYFTPLSPSKAVIEPELSPSAQRALRAKLRNTRIPKVDFKDSTVREAIDFLVKKSKDLDPEPRGVGIPLRISGDKADVAHVAPPAAEIPGLPEVSKLPSDPIVPETTRGSEATPRMTFRMTNASLEEIIDEVCRRAKLNWKVSSHGLVFTPAPSKT